MANRAGAFRALFDQTVRHGITGAARGFDPIQMNDFTEFCTGLARIDANRSHDQGHMRGALAALRDTFRRHGGRIGIVAMGKARGPLHNFPAITQVVFVHTKPGDFNQVDGFAPSFRFNMAFNARCNKFGRGLGGNITQPANVYGCSHHDRLRLPKANNRKASSLRG